MTASARDPGSRGAARRWPPTTAAEGASPPRATVTSATRARRPAEGRRLAGLQGRDRGRHHHGPVDVGVAPTGQQRAESVVGDREALGAEELNSGLSPRSAYHARRPAPRPAAAARGRPEAAPSWPCR